jgi:hypothetical protein
MRTLAWSLVGPLTVVLLVGCGGPLVMENPTTGERVDCTTAAMSVTPTSEFSDTGKGVPQKTEVAPGLQEYDYERRCAAELKREGFVCVAGC